MSIERVIRTAAGDHIVVAVRVPGHLDLDIHQPGTPHYGARLTTADTGRLIERIRARLS